MRRQVPHVHASMVKAATIFYVHGLQEDRPIANSPMRLPLNPPPMTSRSASFQAFNFRNVA